MVIKEKIKEQEMGLAVSQVRFLTLTRRKADCELGISLKSMEKMALTREQSDLSSEYQSKLKSKKIVYYNNGQYYNMNYGYLMGYGANHTAVTNGTCPLKDDNSMILTDYKGQVVLSDAYANAIISVMGSSIMDIEGRGQTFSESNIPQIMANLLPGYSVEEIQAVLNGDDVSSSYTGTETNLSTGESGDQVTVDTTKINTGMIQQIIDFYYPIFQAAAANGWTTEYNQEMNANNDYVSDALASGVFQLEEVNSTGNYEPGTSLTYFTMSGRIAERTDSDAREEITAWYNEEKARISEKEDYLDIEIKDLSTELEAINTELQAVKSYIDNAISSVFDWGSA